MARIKRATIKKAKHKKVLKSTKGFRGAKSKLYRVAREAAMHAGQYAYAGRRLRKRDKRAEAISAISAALVGSSLKYSEFTKKLKDENIALDRKILSLIAGEDPATFEAILKKISK
jgi:large subunit ribosomal protein L20